MTSSALPRLIVKLNKSVASLNRSISYDLSKDIRGLRFELKETFSPIQNLRKAFSGAEGLQKRALSVNSNLLKVTSVNAESLKRMRGDFFDNAEDLLKNFSEGIRENSDGLNDLLVRMRLTGQDQAVAREMAKSMLELTGKDITAVDKLSKNTTKLSSEYAISSEKLIDSINSLRGVMEPASVFGFSDELANITQELRAMTKGLGGDELTKTLGFLFDTSIESIPAKIALGINDTFEVLGDRFTDAQRTDEIIRRIDIAANTLRQNLKVQEGTYKVNLTQFQFGRYASADTLNALLRFSDLLKNSNDLTNKMRGNSEDFTKTAENAAAEALNFYKTTTAEFYPKVLDYLGGLTKGIAGGAAGALAGGITGRIGGALIGGTTGARLGPWGALIGTVIGAALPSLLGSGEDDKNRFRKELDEATRTRKAVEEINQREKAKDGSKSEQSTVSSYLRNAAQSLSDIVYQMNRSKESQMIELLQQQNRILEKQLQEAKRAKAGGL